MECCSSPRTCDPVSGGQLWFASTGWKGGPEMSPTRSLTPQLTTGMRRAWPSRGLSLMRRKTPTSGGPFPPDSTQGPPAEVGVVLFYSGAEPARAGVAFVAALRGRQAHRVLRLVL